MVYEIVKFCQEKELSLKPKSKGRVEKKREIKDEKKQIASKENICPVVELAKESEELEKGEESLNLEENTTTYLPHDNVTLPHESHDVISDTISNKGSSLARAKLLELSQFSVPASTITALPKPIPDLMVTPLKEPHQMIPLSGDRGQAIRGGIVYEPIPERNDDDMSVPVTIHPEPLLEVTFQDDIEHEVLPQSHGVPVTPWSDLPNVNLQYKDNAYHKTNNIMIPNLPEVRVDKDSNGHHFYAHPKIIKSSKEVQVKDTTTEKEMKEMEQTIQELLKQNQEMLARIFLLESRVNLLEDERNNATNILKGVGKIKETGMEVTSEKDGHSAREDEDRRRHESDKTTGKAVVESEKGNIHSEKGNDEKVYTPDNYRCADGAEKVSDDDDDIAAVFKVNVANSDLAPSRSLSDDVVSPLATPTIAVHFSDPSMQATLQNLEQKFKETKDMLTKSSKNQALLLSQIENIPAMD